jgi:hypothetical protein
MNDDCLNAYELFERQYRYLIQAYKEHSKLELDENSIDHIKLRVYKTFAYGLKFISIYYKAKGKGKEWKSLAVQEGLIDNGDVWLSMIQYKNEFLTENYEGRAELFKKLAEDYVSQIVKFYKKMNEIEYESISKWRSEIYSYTPTTLDEEVKLSFISKIKKNSGIYLDRRTSNFLIDFNSTLNKNGIIGIILKIPKHPLCLRVSVAKES